MAQCSHHESIDHRLKRLEGRMDRIEIGIFGALVAVSLALCGLFIQVWDLPGQLRKAAAESAEGIK